MGLDLTGYNFVYGNNKNNNFTLKNTEGPDVFCGLGGNDSIGTLDEGDIFIGGAGNDQVDDVNYGTFIGGDGNDRAIAQYFGTVYGGAGDDRVSLLKAGSYFYGGDGNDTLDSGRGEDGSYFDQEG